MNKIKEFIVCARPHSFPAAIAPVLLGSIFSLNYVKLLNYKNLFIYLLACILIQAATNYFNEYYDYKRGLDKIDSQGISASILKNKLSANEVLYAAIIFYLIAFILGVYLSYLTSFYLLFVGIICMLVGYFYTGGKYPIAYSPFGEIFAGFFMGTVIIAIAFYLQTRFVNINILIISIPLFIMIGTILLANSIRDLDNDKVSGRKTYAILVGRHMAIKTILISFMFVYLINVIFIFTSLGSIFNLLPLITLPMSIKIYKGFKNNFTKETMAQFMPMTAKLTIFIGCLMSLAYLLDILLK